MVMAQLNLALNARSSQSAATHAAAAAAYEPANALPPAPELDGNGDKHELEVNGNNDMDVDGANNVGRIDGANSKSDMDVDGVNKNDNVAE